MSGKRYYSLVTDNQNRTADLYIFGDISDARNTGIDEAIGWDIGEVSGLSIAKDLQGLDVDVINVHINSLGGYTAEGLAIMNVLKSHPAKIVTYCDGFACSAASLIFMAGDERIMGAASALMIHNAWIGGAEGNAAQLRRQADNLDKISQAAGNAYASAVNIDRKTLDALLDGDNHEGTWILPEDAVKMGFATKVSGEVEVQSSVANQSVTRRIISRMTEKPQAVDTDSLAEEICQKLTRMAKQEGNPAGPSTNTQEGNPAEPSKNTMNIFLSALSKRGKE